MAKLNRKGEHKIAARKKPKTIHQKTAKQKKNMGKVKPQKQHLKTFYVQKFLSQKEEKSQTNLEKINYYNLKTCCYHGPMLEFTTTIPGVGLSSNRPDSKTELCCAFNRDVKYPNCNLTKEKEQQRLDKFESLIKNKLVRTQLFKNKLERKDRINEGVDEDDENSNLPSVSPSEISKTIKFPRNPIQRKLLSFKTEDSTNAQYLLSDRSIEFIKDKFLENHDQIFCIGMPRLHEEILNSADENLKSSKKSILLDIDERFNLFYPESFIKFNMFNCHFFEGYLEKFKSLLEKLNFDPEKRILLVVDPPFSGLAAAFIDSFNWLKSVVLEDKFKIDIAWIFPYFFHKDIRKLEPFLGDEIDKPSINPVNFIVDYDNHPRFQNRISGHKQSPVRIFTNIDLKKLIVPEHLCLDYENNKVIKFCKKSKISVFTNSNYCDICQKNFGHDKLKFRHCEVCGICVKEKWVHCDRCGKCLPVYHNCKKL